MVSVLGAAACALAVWTVAVPVGGLELTVRTGGSVQAVGAGAVAVSSVLTGMAGWGLLAVLERFTARAGRTWTMVALGVLVLSVLGPLGAGLGAVTRIVLVAMHLIVGAVLIVGLGRSARR